MTLSAPLNSNETADLLARKDELVAAIGKTAGDLGLTVDYSFEMMREARQMGLRSIDLLEMLVELEAIKYTLCARRLREELGE